MWPPTWTYGTTVYDRRIIADDPAFMHSYNLSWVGCPWNNDENVDLWAGAVRESRLRYGARDTAQGMMCTNWGGGRFEPGLAPMAQRAWNLHGATAATAAGS